IDERIDSGRARALVPDAEAEVQHERLFALGGEADGVVHRLEHAARRRDRTVRVVRDLESEQLGTGRHPVEAVDAVYPAAGGDAGDVRSVAAGVEVEMKRRLVT